MGCQCSNSKDIPSSHEVALDTINNNDNNNNYSTNDIYNHLLEQSLLKEFNFARMFPDKYINIIEKYRSKVNYNIQTKTYFLNANSNLTIIMKKGNEAIEKCIEHFRKRKKISALTFCNELCLKVSDTDQDPNKFLKCSSLDYIEKILREKYTLLCGKYNILSFHYDKNSACGELSAFCQIVDDTGSNLIRRRNILNPKATHVGISCFNIENNVVCFYIILASLITSSSVNIKR